MIQHRFLRNDVRSAALFLAATTMCSAAPASPGSKPTTRVRSEIPAQYRWDFSAIYPDWEAWQAATKIMEAKMDEFAALKGTLSQGPEAVLKAYKAYDEIGMLQYKVYRYP